MAQLTNTRIYGNLNVDAITTLNGALNANGGINLNSMIVDDKQNSANNENKLSSIKLISENKTYRKPETGSPVSSAPSQHNSLYSYIAEIKNNAGKLLSLDLHKVNSEEYKTFDGRNKVKTYNIDIDDTLYNVSVGVSNFYKASDSEPKVSYDNGTSTYESNYTTAKTEKPADATDEIFRGNTYTTKSTVNLQLTVPYEGGRIITDKTCDDERIARQFCVEISTTEQLNKLLAKNSRFKRYVRNNITMGAPGVILYAFLYTTGTLTNTGEEYESANPITFYCEVNDDVKAYYFSSGSYKSLTTLGNGKSVYIILSTKYAADEIKEIIA